MAGNFWQSSHFEEWMLDKQELLTKRHADLQFVSEDEYQKVMIFFANFIQAVGEALKVRQQVIGTATLYFKRYYSRSSFKCIDPFLMSPTCVYLAAKVEEYGPLPNNKLVQVCSTLVKTKFAYAYSKQQEYPYRIGNILECEFFLLEMMDCCLIVYQPYRPLIDYCSKLGDTSILPLAWKVVNDSLRTDVTLLYPPYMIALAGMYMASVMLQKDHQQWFAELSVDFDKVFECVQTIMTLYDLWKSGYDEKANILSILDKLPKPNTNPSRT